MLDCVAWKEGEILICASSPGSTFASIKNCIPYFFVSLAINARTPPCFCVKIGCVHDLTSLPFAAVVTTPFTIKNCLLL